MSAGDGPRTEAIRGAGHGLVPVRERLGGEAVRGELLHAADELWGCQSAGCTLAQTGLMDGKRRTVSRMAVVVINEAVQISQSAWTAVNEDI